MDQQTRLSVGPDRVRNLRYALGQRARRGHLNPGRIPGHPQCEVVNGVRHRRREQQGLRPLAEASHHLLDLGAESHVEHPVGLVQDEEPHALQFCRPPILKIDQTAGRGDDDFVSALEGIHLGPVGNPSAYHGRPYIGAPRQRLGVVADLLRQFPRGAKDQHLKSRSLRQRFQRRQHERSGLPRARAGNPHHIASTHDERDCLALNGSRLRPSQRLHCGEARLGEAEAPKFC